jgi:DNA-binding transcriptional MocR family regulator
MWLPELGPESGPKYIKIADAIAQSIADGRLIEGQRLPPQRDLAYELGFSLNTVSRAYEEATNRGFLHGEVGRGTYVRMTGPLPLPDNEAGMIRPVSGPIDFSLNLPAPGQGAAALSKTLAELQASRDLAPFLDYQFENVHDRHAEAAAGWLERVGLDVQPRDIVLTCGAQHGLLVILLATMRPGDVLLAEATTYPPVKALAQHTGIRLEPVNIDEGGLVPAALDLACKTTAAKTLYCLPTLHTPMTTTMDDDRRKEIAAIARKHDLQIIEDDVFAILPRRRPRPLACYAPERTVYVTSVSKSLAPGLRIGYVCTPAGQSRLFRAAVNLSCWMPPPMMAEIASRWIADGTADRLNEAQRLQATDRQALAKRLLPSEVLTANRSGFHAWLDLPAHWPSEAFCAEAERQGVKLIAGEAFAIRQSEAPNGVRLCLSHEASRDRVRTGLERVAAILKAPAASRDLII